MQIAVPPRSSSQVCSVAHSLLAPMTQIASNLERCQFASRLLPDSGWLAAPPGGLWPMDPRFGSGYQALSSGLFGYPRSDVTSWVTKARTGGGRDGGRS